MALPWGYIGTESVIAAVLIVVRLVVCAVPLFLVFYVTKLTDMANALVKVLHVPYKYAFTFMSTVHFIPVFMNDMSGIMEAQTARGVEFDGGIAKKIRLMMPLCVPLLVSSVRKTNSAAIAAEVRGVSTCAPAGFKNTPGGMDWRRPGRRRPDPRRRHRTFCASWARRALKWACLRLGGFFAFRVRPEDFA